VCDGRGVLLSRLLQRRGARLVLALHGVLAVLLCLVPLFDVLGFERAFATGLITTPAAAALAVAARRAAPDARPGDVAWAASALGLLALLPTLLAGLGVELWTSPCSPGEGLVFLVLGPVTQTLLGVALGVVATALPLSRAHPGWAVAAVLLGSLGLSLQRLWAEPQIFVYSLPFGYWPGSLYDEAVAPSLALYAHRGLAVLVALGLVALTELRRSPRAWAVLGLAVAGGGVLSHHGEALGFDRSRATVERALSRTVRTERWTLHVDPSIGEERLARLVDELGLRTAQLERFFGTRPSLHMHAYVYADDAQKQALMGAAATQLARPWQGELHVSRFDVPHPSLKHELAHLYAGELASGFLRVPARARVLVNLGLVEGVAVAADWPVRGGLTVHQWARAMRALGVAPSPERVVYPSGFWAEASVRAYTIAGSFVRHLVDTRGIGPLGRAYASNDFEGAYGVPMATLVDEWARTIDALPLSDAERTLAEHRFRAPSIFGRTCPHTTANLVEAAALDLARGETDAALPALERAFGYDASRLDVLLLGAKALGRVGRVAEAEAWATRARETPGATARGRATAVEALADLAWRADRRDAAARGYHEVRALGLSDESWRLMTVKLEALTRSSSVAAALRTYLAGERPLEQAGPLLAALVQAHPGDALLHYLYAKLLENVGLPAEAAEAARTAQALGLSDAALRSEAQLMEARGRLWSGARAEAAVLLGALVATSTRAGPRAEAEDWLERARRAPE
jgi:hypothetical protein